MSIYCSNEGKEHWCWFISFFAANCLQMSLFIVLLEGVLSYNHPGSKESAPSPLIIFDLTPFRCTVTLPLEGDTVLVD